MPATISAIARLLPIGIPVFSRTKSRMPVATSPRLARLMQLNSRDMLMVLVRMNASRVMPPS